MSDNYFERLSFVANWWQKEADMFRPFIMNFYPKDNSVEIYDRKTRKMFLRRTPLNTLNTLNSDRATPKHIYVGAKLNIFGRQYNITDYADDSTKIKLSSHRESTFCLLKPDAIPHMDKILNRFQDEKFTIGNCKMVQMNTDCASYLFIDEIEDAATMLSKLVESITSGPVLVLELFGQNSIRRLLDVVGPEDPNEAKQLCPNSIRAKYGTSLVKNLMFCSSSIASATKVNSKNIQYFFTDNQIEPYVTMRGTLGIVKPHAVQDGKLGGIISVIYENNLKITGMRMIYMERECCEEFLEVYKGVMPEYNQMVLEFISGPSIGIEISSNECQLESHTTLHGLFREICGPIDPEIGKKIRPKSIRAKFAVNKIQNAIHCTDLEEDIQLELNRFFKTLK